MPKKKPGPGGPGPDTGQSCTIGSRSTIAQLPTDTETPADRIDDTRTEKIPQLPHMARQQFLAIAPATVAPFPPASGVQDTPSEDNCVVQVNEWHMEQGFYMSSVVYYPRTLSPQQASFFRKTLHRAVRENAYEVRPQQENAS